MKKVQKTLTGAMAAMMATGVVATPAMAATNNTDVDALYKAAYQATMKVLATKGQSATEQQTAINEARQAIKALPANLETAIGEFSKQVDTIQGPIFANIMKAIKEAQTTKTQAAVNEARKAIPTNLADFYKKPYSSAVDAVQKELQDNAFAAVKKAEAEKKQDLIDAAKALVKELATADSQAIKNYANTLNERLEAVKVYDLEVAKVDSITTTGVKVSFKALKEALREVTLEVIDNKGNKVDVDSKKVLIEGETSASFTFTTALRNRPEGVWTVNGVELDLDQINLINDVKAAKDKAALYDVLKVTDLVSNVKEANSQLYLDEIKKAPTTIVTVEDLQKLIDKINEGVLAQSDVNYLIDMAKKGTDNQFKNALLSMNLDKVNTSWLDAYREKITSNKTLEDIKTSIKTVNNEKVKYDQNKNLINSKLDETKIVNNIDLLEEYYVFDSKKEDEVKAKEAELNKYKLDLAIVTVNNADTQTSLKSALLNLEKVLNDKTKFEYAKSVNEDILSYYVKANSGNALSYTTIVSTGGVLDKGYEAALSEVVKNIATKANIVVEANDKVTDSQKNDLLNEYKNLVKVTAKNDKFDIKIVNEELIVEYAKVAKNYIDTTKVSNIVADIDNVNKTTESPAITAIKGAENADKLLEALKNATLGLKNVVDANKDAYINENVEVNGVKSGFQALSNKDDIQNLVNAVNAAQVVLTSNNIDEVSNAVLSFAVSAKGNEEVKNLNSLVRKDVAEEVKVLLKDVKSLTTEELTTKLGTAIDNQEANILAINSNKNMNNVNMAGILKNISSEFKNLSEVNKITVAEKFIAKFPKDSKGNKIEFKNYTEIRTLLAECMK